MGKEERKVGTAGERASMQEEDVVKGREEKTWERWEEVKYYTNNLSLSVCPSFFLSFCLSVCVSLLFFL